MAAWRSGTALSVLTFDLQGELFALEASIVREILDMVPVTNVPGTDAFVSGLINVRGRVIPLADLRLRLGMDTRAATIDTRIVVLEIDIGGDPTILGIRADKVHEVTDLPTSMLEDVPRIGLRWPTKYIQKIGKRGSDFIMVLDLAGVFSLPEASADTALLASLAA